MFEPVFLAQQALNGLSFGALLFLLASGLTLVFGLMRIINLAHGAFYMIGGYIGVVVAGLTGNLLLAVHRCRRRGSHRLRGRGGAVAVRPGPGTA